jgi:hypothetical protein
MLELLLVLFNYDVNVNAIVDNWDLTLNPSLSVLMERLPITRRGDKDSQPIHELECGPRPWEIVFGLDRGAGVWRK